MSFEFFRKKKGSLKHRADIATEVTEKNFSPKMKNVSDKKQVARKTKRYIFSCNALRKSML